MGGLYASRMPWPFDQPPDAACITCRAVLEGAPVLVVTHYEDDHSWAFLDGQVHDAADAVVVAMASVFDIHPNLGEVADLLPGWSATRENSSEEWSRQAD